MDISIFEDIGLTKREIIVYLALLELGSTTIGYVLEKTQIPSSKIYEVLNRLRDKGLVSCIKIENKKHFQASDPKSILSILDEKKARISEIIPNLAEKQKSVKKKQSVEMYEGYKAIFNLLRNIIQDAKQKELYLAFTHGEEHKDATINIFYKSFIKRRREKKLDMKLLANIFIKPLFKEIYTKEEFKDTKIRFTEFSFPHGLTIFRDNLIYISWKENPTAVKIQSKQMAEEFRRFFLGLWDMAKK